MKNHPIVIEKKEEVFRTRFNPGLLLIEILTFFLVQAFGLWIGYMIFAAQGFKAEQESGISWWFILSFAIGTVVVLIFLKFVKLKLFFHIIFDLVLFLGTSLVLSLWLPQLHAYALSAVIVVLRYLIPNVLMQNIVVILSVVGVSTVIGLVIPPYEVIIILAVLSVYDFIAVFKTKHMVTMFKGLLSYGVAFSLVIPFELKGFLQNQKLVQKEMANEERKYVFLGTGDLAFPLIFAVSALTLGIYYAIGIIIGASVGMFCIHLILVYQKQKRAIPALPPIAAFSILGFLIVGLILR